MGNWWNNFTQELNPVYDVQQAWQGIQSLGGDVAGFFKPDVSGQPVPARGGTQVPSSSGIDWSKLFGGGLAGGGAGGGYSGGGSSGPAGYTTPDGVFVADGSAEDRFYKLVDAVWSKVFGAHPDFAQARVFHDMGIENTDQLQQVLLQMPSHIKGPDGIPITIGVYEDMLTTGNKFAQQYFGRPIPDSLITQWVASGTTEPAAIENWFWSHPANDIPKDQYGAIWDAANNWTQKVWGDFKG